MNFMVAVDHAFKVAGRGFPDGAEIDMDDHEERDTESGDDMKQVGEMQTARPKDRRRYRIRVKQGETGNEHQGDQQVHHPDIGELLQGIEFSLFRDGEGCMFIAEDAERIKHELAFQPDEDSLVFHLVIPPVEGEYVSEKEDYVVDSKDDPCDIMDCHCCVEPYEGHFRGGELHADAGDDEYQAEKGIGEVPEPDPNRIEVYFFRVHGWLSF
jgi:hypothetical protein